MKIQNTKKKCSITLLEVVIAIVLLGVLLTGLFNSFRQGLTKNLSARELKQKALQLELFQQKIKNLFSAADGVWIEDHPESVGLSLYVNFEEKIDPDFDMRGKLQGMLFLNAKKEVCFVNWTKNGEGRIETLLDVVDSFKCRLFDPKKGEWNAVWPQKKEESAVMAAIDLTWNGSKIPFVFFLKPSNEKISYSGVP